MPELLKNMYNPLFFEHVASLLQEIIPQFSKETFINKVFTPDWNTLELKARMRHISHILAGFLPQAFPLALPYILTIKQKASLTKLNPFAFMFLPDYVEQYGIADVELSVKALEELTAYCSAEFAVRPFLIQYPPYMLAQMLRWSVHPNVHVRRLASEGCRPRLPWAIAVPGLKKDPSPIMPILENLKADPSEYVRRSVANNLNDISKDHPQLVIDYVKAWKGVNPLTDKLLKHGCRTLIKQGNQELLPLFDFDPTKTPTIIQPLKLNKENFIAGETAEFSFTCSAGQQATIRLQYIIEFAKKSGKRSKKVFYLGEKCLKAGEVYTFRKKIKLVAYSTRKLYAGQHMLAVMVNGEIKTTASFYLQMHEEAL